MTHRLGRGVIHLPLGLRLTDQPSERLYTYFRNQVAMLRLPHVPSAWKLRFIASLPARCLIYALRNGFARPAVSAIIFGLIDGIAHRLGPPPRPAGNLVRFLRSFPTPTRIARFRSSLRNFALTKNRFPTYQAPAAHSRGSSWQM
jgi:hypothetical protein